MRRRRKDLRRRKLQAKIRRQREQLAALAGVDALRAAAARAEGQRVREQRAELEAERTDLRRRYTWKFWRRLRFVVTGH